MVIATTVAAGSVSSKRPIKIAAIPSSRNTHQWDVGIGAAIAIADPPFATVEWPEGRVACPAGTEFESGPELYSLHWGTRDFCTFCVQRRCLNRIVSTLTPHRD